MLKVFDRLTIKKHCFVVRKEDLIEIMSMIQRSIFTNYFTESMAVRNGGKDVETDNWIINVNLTNLQWKAMLQECKEKKYQLIIKDDPDKKYFTKVKES